MKLNPVELKQLAKLIGKLFRFNGAPTARASDYCFIVTDIKSDVSGDNLIFYQRVSTGRNYQTTAFSILDRVVWLTP